MANERKEYKDSIEKRKQFYKLAQGDDINECFKFLYNETKYYVESQINYFATSTSFFSNSTINDKEDIIHNVYLSAIPMMKSYDTSYALTTWIQTFIRKSLGDEIKSNELGIPLHYVSKLRKLNTVDRIWNDKSNGRPSLLDYYIETKESLITINSALEYKIGEEMVSLDAQLVEEKNEYNVRDYDYYKDSPDKIALQSESSVVIHDVIMKMPFLQQAALFFGENGFIDMIEKVPEFLEKYPQLKNLYKDILFSKNEKIGNRRICDELSKVVGYNLQISEFTQAQVDALNYLSSNSKLVAISGKKKRRKAKDIALVPIELALQDMEALYEADMEEIEASEKER